MPTEKKFTRALKNSIAEGKTFLMVLLPVCVQFVVEYFEDLMGGLMELESFFDD